MEDIYAAHSGGIEPLLVVAMSIDPLRSWNLTDFPGMSHQTQRREAPIGHHGDCAGQQQKGNITKERLYAEDAKNVKFVDVACCGTEPISSARAALPCDSAAAWLMPDGS